MARFIKLWGVVDPPTPDEDGNLPSSLLVPTSKGNKRVRIAGWVDHPVYGVVGFAKPKTTTAKATKAATKTATKAKATRTGAAR